MSSVSIYLLIFTSFSVSSLGGAFALNYIIICHVFFICCSSFCVFVRFAWLCLAETKKVVKSDFIIIIFFVMIVELLLLLYFTYKMCAFKRWSYNILFLVNGKRSLTTFSVLLLSYL